MSKRVFFLVSDQARGNCKRAIDDPAYDGWKVAMTAPMKSRDQEERYHAMIGEIALQYTHCGRKWDAEDMKRLLIDQFKRDTINDPDFKDLWAAVGSVDMAPALDGSGVVMLGTQSRKFPKALATAFIEWLFAFAADAGVEFSQ
jgi:hypothetical protein